MGNNLYDNLLKATNNIDDITTERYATVTKLNGNYCDVKEEEAGLEHTNVPIVNGANLSVGDKVIIGFLNNSIYDVVCYGALDKTVHDDSKQDLLVSGQNIKTINHTSLLGSGNIDIQGGSNVDVVTSWEATLSDTKVPSEKLTKNSLDAKADASSLATVATTGDYDDLTDKPSIPSSSSDLSDGSNIVKKSSTTGLLKNDGTVDTTQYLSSLPTHNHDDRYYTESEVDTALNGKQATLISGTNIKTINNTSLLGSGNISIQGGGTVTVDDSLSTTSTNPVQNKVITGALNGKANSSHAHLSSDVTDLIDVIYPVGSIYMSVNTVSPSILFGFGVWEKIEDKFLLGSGATYENGSTGGSADAVIVSHSHKCADQGEYIVTSEETSANNTKVAYSASGNRWVDGQTSKSNFHHRASTSTVGEDGTGKNMPPYVAVNIWKRTA